MERADAAGLHPLVLDAYERSPLLVLEVDLSDVEPDELLELMLELGRLPEGESLRSRVSGETWELLVEHCASAGCRVDELDRLEPWLVALHLVGTALESEGLDAEHGVEHRLLERAGAKRVVGLETPREQFALFDGLAPQQQELMLRDALVSAVDSAAELDELVGAWRRGDAAVLEALLFGHLEQSPDLAPFYEATFFARNRHMTRGIESLLADTPYAFVVLGAGHLVGPRGIPALLEARGYRVRQVRSRPRSSGARPLVRGGRTVSAAPGGGSR